MRDYRKPYLELFNMAMGRTNRPKTVTMLANEMGCHTGALRWMIKKLVRDGYLVIVGRGKCHATGRFALFYQWEYLSRGYPRYYPKPRKRPYKRKPIR